MEFKKIFGRFFPSLLYRIRFPTISVEGKKKRKETGNWEVDSISLLINVFVSKFRNQSAALAFRNEKKAMKKRGTRGKKYSIDSHGQGRMYFFWKHRHHLVSPSSFLKRMEKQYFDVSCPKFSIPLSYSTRLSMHLFFVSDFFVPTNYTHTYLYIYIDCAREKRKNKQLLSMHSSTICQIMQVYGSLISLSILINTKE